MCGPGFKDGTPDMCSKLPKLHEAVLEGTHRVCAHSQAALANSCHNWVLELGFNSGAAAPGRGLVTASQRRSPLGL